MQYIIGRIVGKVTMIDKIYIINIKHRGDRRSHIISEMNRLNLSNYDIINATIIKSNINPNMFSCISCFHSHIKTLRIAYNNNVDNALILEDDAIFYNNISNNVLEFFNSVKEASLLYLGCNLNIYKDGYVDRQSVVNKIHNNIVELNEAGTAHAILYNKKYIRQMYEMFPDDETFFNRIFSGKFPHIYDNFINWYTINNNIKKYCIYPIICNQKDFYSDIQFSDVNYEKEIINSWKYHDNIFDTSYTASYSRRTLE